MEIKELQFCPFPSTHQRGRAKSKAESSLGGPVEAESAENLAQIPPASPAAPADDNII